MKKVKFSINQHSIKEYGKVFIIAEAGVNHNQKLDLALKLIDTAAETGADAVKFQTFKAEQVVREKGEMASYQKKNTGKVQTQRQMLRGLELPEEFYPELIKRCRQKKILFMSTPHGGKASVDLLEKFNISCYKIGSGDLTNFLLLERVAKTKKPIILSSGMSTLVEAKNAINFVRSKGNNQIAILHCTTNYPCPLKEVNLLAMKTMMENLDVPVGYSDHTEGSQVVIMAAAMGMAIYECHFTSDKNLPGPDHIASAAPYELKERIQIIRKVRVILGKKEKIPNQSEIVSMIPLVRKSIVATRDLKKGHIISSDDLEAKRPGNGLSPIFYESLLAKKLKRQVKKDEKIKLEYIKN